MTIAEVVKAKIEEHKYLCYANTSMILDVICEQLAAEKINATWSGRTIYIDDKPIASITTYREKIVEGYVVSIDKYFMKG